MRGKTSRDDGVASLTTERIVNNSGIDIVAGGPEVFNPFLDKQMDTWGKFIIDNKIKETN